MNRRHSRSCLVCYLGFALSVPWLFPSDVALAEAASGASNVRALAGPPSVELRSRRRGDERYRFAIGTCEGSAAFKVCPFSVHLVQGTKAAVTAALDPVWSDQIVPVATSAVPGLGEPLGNPSRWGAWKIGGGENAQTLGALVVRLGTSGEGVLLRRVHGGAARDVLVVAPSTEGQPLRVVPLVGRWSALDTQPRGSQSDQLVLFAQWPGEPGFVWAKSLAWNERAGTLEDSQPDPAVQVVALGPFPTEAAAAAASKPACLPGGVIAPTDPYEGIAPGGYMVAAVTTDQRLARATLASGAACAHAPNGSVFPLRFRWLPKASYPIRGDTRAEIGLGPYDGTGWPLRIALSESGKILDRLDVAWPVSTPVMTSAQDLDLPVGDPLHPLRAHAPELSGWSMGDSAAAPVVAIRTLRAPGDRKALLVTMEAGSERRKRWHQIVSFDAGRIGMAWNAADPEGPSWSTVVVRAQPDGADDVLYLSVFEASEEGHADTLRASRLAWNTDAQSLSAAELACDGSISLAVVRAFPTLKGALAAKDRACASADRTATIHGQRPLVLPAPRGSGLRGYVLAYVSTDKVEARRAATEGAKCWTQAHPTVISWCGRQNKGG